MDQAIKNKLTNLSPQQLKALIKKMGKERKELPHMPRNEARHYPVTSAQKRMWFLSKLDPEAYLYTNPIGIRIRAKVDLDIDLYVHGFRTVVQRHEIMRTSFFNQAGRIVQQIHDDLPVTIGRIDLRSYPEAEKQARVEAILAKDGQTPIRIEDFPLFTFKVLVLSNREFVLLYTSHHIISDAWSSSHIFREMQTIYDQVLSGTSADAPRLSYQFVDYVHWEQTWLESDAYKEALAKWTQLLPAVPEPLNLPLDYVRPSVIRYDGGLEKACLTAELVGNLTEFSKREGVNLFHTLLAAFNVLLHAYSRNEEIVVGIPLANRKLKEFHQTVGMFLNTLPHRTTISPDELFRTYLQQVKSVSQDMIVHQDVPFEKLVEVLNPPRDLSTAPIFQVLFVFQNIPAMYQWDDLDISPIKPDYHISKYELNLWIEEVAGELFLSLTFQTHLFRQETVQRFLNNYVSLLETVISRPDSPLGDLWATPAGTLAASPVVTADTEPYIHRFEAQAAAQGDALALVCDTVRFSYRALNEQANQLANYLLQQKQRSDQIIAFLLPRSAEQIVAILAIHKAGCAYLPIDPSIPTERLQALLTEAGAGIVITTQTYCPLLTGTPQKQVLLDTGLEMIRQCSAQNPGGVVQPQDLAYVLYTSGTTGLSKGVCIEHAQLANYAVAVWKRINLPADSRFATVSGITTDLGNTQIFPALMHGASVDLIPDEYVTNPTGLAKYVQDHAIDCLKLVPSLLTSLLRTQAAADVLPRQLLILGGERTTAALVTDIRSYRSDLRIINHYGPTETTIGVLTHEIGNVAPNELIPLGLPLDYNAVFIMDDKQRILPDGMPGELVVSGLNVGRGYHRQDALSNTVFLPNLHGMPVRSYRTGDMGRRRADGLIEFLGRKDRQLKIRGFRVEPAVIERAILTNTTLAQAVVTDHDGCSLVAYVVPKEKAAEPYPGLKQQLRSRLPAYMVPDEIILVDELPRLSSGKINVRALSKHIPAVVGSVPQAVFPRDETELAISKIWKEVLKQESVSVTDHFFDTGGTSLIAIELVAKINQAFGSELGIGVLFESSTIQSIARLLKGGQYATDSSPLLLLKKGNTDNYLFLVHPAGGDVLSYYALAAQIDPSFHVYGLQAKNPNQSDSSIEALAERYLAVIRQTVPAGRYVVGGWSMGAYVAYEMAQQWQAGTGQALPVIILDQRAPVLPGQPNQPPARSVLERQVAFARKIEYLTGQKNKLTTGLLAPLTSTERTALFLDVFKKGLLVPEELGPEPFQGFLDKMMEHHDITARYSATGYSGPTLLIRAMDSTAFDDDERPATPAYGWSDFIPETLWVETVPGNHVSIIRQPYVGAVAGKINAAITSPTSSAQFQPFLV